MHAAVLMAVAGIVTIIVADIVKKVGKPKKLRAGDELRFDDLCEPCPRCPLYDEDGNSLTPQGRHRRPRTYDQPME